MAIRIGINGFGRIGRLVARAIFERGSSDFDLIAANDLTDAKTLAHLFKYDSVHGKFQGSVEVDGNDLIINGDRLKIFSQRDPGQLPWGDVGCDIVVESTGFFRSRDKAALHLEGGAKKVIISAPPSGQVDATVVLGVNDHILTGDEEVVSNASCTTNCLAPMVKVLDDKFGVSQGYMTTIHAYTSDQNLADAPHKDLRRARAAAVNMIPTTTGAAKAVGVVLPKLAGKLDGYAVRVPTTDGSLTDLTVMLKRDVSAEELNAAIKAAADSDLKGILEYSDEPLVSTDIIHNPHSCIFDSLLTSTNGSMAKVVGWYDNEWGYSNRTVDLIKLMMS